MSAAPVIRHLGLAPYEPTWRAMQRFTDGRDDSTPDEIWFVEHPPVFTLGLNASREHLLAPGDIPEGVPELIFEAHAGAPPADPHAAWCVGPHG